MIKKEVLEKLYLRKKHSMQEIAEVLKCSLHKVSYWMDQYNIERRSISEANYVKYNPNGDPFKIRTPKTMKEAQLFGMGLGLYWGEGTKASKNAVRLGNSDPALLREFMSFLTLMCGVNKGDMKFELQIFEDVNQAEVESLWLKALDINRKQMYKTRVTSTRGNGTYRKKNKNGVMAMYYGNTKLRNRLVDLLPM